MLDLDTDVWGLGTCLNVSSLWTKLEADWINILEHSCQETHTSSFVATLLSPPLVDYVEALDEAVSWLMSTFPIKPLGRIEEVEEPNGRWSMVIVEGQSLP